MVGLSSLYNFWKQKLCGVNFSQVWTRLSQLAYCWNGTFPGVSFSQAERPVDNRKLPWTLILCRMDQSTPCAQVTDKHRSCDTSSRAALHRLQLVPEPVLPPLRPIIRAVISFCQHHRNTETPPAPTHPSARPANTLSHKHTQGLSVCLLSKHPSHTQVIDFYSSCNLLDGWKKVSQSLHTVMHSV